LPEGQLTRDGFIENGHRLPEISSWLSHYGIAVTEEEVVEVDEDGDLIDSDLENEGNVPERTAQEVCY
jgi:hypothetical protein